MSLAPFALGTLAALSTPALDAPPVEDLVAEALSRSPAVAAVWMDCSAGLRLPLGRSGYREAAFGKAGHDERAFRRLQDKGPSAPRPSTPGKPHHRCH